MDKVQIKPNVISNWLEIVQDIEELEIPFYSREKDYGVLSSSIKNEIGYSRLESAYKKHLPDGLLTKILSNFDTKTQITHTFLQIQRYVKGSYILPHRDNYNVGLRLFTLSTSEYDGLTVQSEDGFIFVPDIGGQEIIFDRSAWHWVNPVRDRIRYSLVIGLAS